MTSNKKDPNNTGTKPLTLGLMLIGTLLFGTFMGYELNRYKSSFVFSSEQDYHSKSKRAEEILRFIDARYINYEVLDSLSHKAAKKSLF